MFVMPTTPIGLAQGRRVERVLRAVLAEELTGVGNRALHAMNSRAVQLAFVEERFGRIHRSRPSPAQERRQSLDQRHLIAGQKRQKLAIPPQARLARLQIPPRQLQ